MNNYLCGYATNISRALNRPVTFMKVAAPSAEEAAERVVGSLHIPTGMSVVEVRVYAELGTRAWYYDDGRLVRDRPWEEASDA